MLPSLLTDTVSSDVRRATDTALLWGLEAVALRTIGRERVPNTNESRLRKVVEEAEMPVVWVDPGLFEGAAASRAGVLNDLEGLREVAPFCARLGCAVVAVGALAEIPRSVPEAARALRQVGEVAAGLGLRVAIRNSAEASSAIELAVLVREVAHPAVGALWDVAASLAAGDDPAEAAHMLTEAGLFGVESDEAVALDGAAVSALARVGYDGPVVLAFSGPADDGLDVSTALIRSIRQARRAAREA